MKTGSADWAAPVRGLVFKLCAAWDRGDMDEFRRLAATFDAAWSEDVFDAHADELADTMRKAVGDAVVRTVRSLSAVGYGFGSTGPEALEYMAGKVPVASGLDSSAWKDVPVALRNRAMFSARLADEATASAMRAKIRDSLFWRPGVDNGPMMDSGRFARDMRALMEDGGVSTVPGGGSAAGGLRDIRSNTRLGLVFDTQTLMAHGWAARKTGCDPAVLAAVPGWIFTRVEPRDHPRSVWADRWRKAVASVGGEGCLASPMIALKSSPVWQALGDLGPFGNPFPPFDFGSGMGVEDADRDMCVSAGLIGPDDEIDADDVPPLDGNMVETVAGIEDDVLNELKSIFGDEIRVSGGKAAWRRPSRLYTDALDPDSHWGRSADWKPDRMLPLADPEESAARARAGIAVVDPLGNRVALDGEVVGHTAKDVARMAFLDDYLETIRNPQEVVTQERQRNYYRTDGTHFYQVSVATGGGGASGDETTPGHVRTVIPHGNPRKCDKSRHGLSRMVLRK